MAHNFLITSSVLANGKTAYYAKLTNSDEPRFLIGYRTKYHDNYGIYNTTVQNALSYKPQDYVAEFDFWAYFITPTAKAESGFSYICLNTYDRARFTFSYMQYAAHVENGDFVVFFKKLLALPNASLYFPKLRLHNHRIHYVNTNNALVPLESDTTTEPLMNYLNPTLNDVENQELVCSARMIHWATNDPAHRRIQVETAIEHFKNNMIEYHHIFGLNNAPAKVCLLICDIRHQGRGSNGDIISALNTNGNWERAYNNLCSIGSFKYKTRITTVKNMINSLTQSGLFNKKYQASNNSFVNI